MTKALATIELPEMCDPRVAFTVWAGGELRIDATDDWCGDTETGFGATVGVTLNPAQVKQLVTFLQQNLEYWNQITPT